MIDIATNMVTDTITIGIGNTPNSLAITPDGKYAYVCVHDENLVAVIDLATNTVIKTIPVENNPWGVAIQTVYIPTRGIFII